MKNNYIIFCLLMISLLQAQTPIIGWQKAYGGNSYDVMNKSTKTSDGGYICSGWSNSNISSDKTVNTNGGYDYWIIKTNALGSIEWQKSFGVSALESCLPIIQTTDGGYLVGGNSSSNISGNKTENSKGFDDIWVIKLDNLGNIEWQKDIGGGANDWVVSIIETADGGYLLGGNSYSGISGDKTEPNTWDGIGSGTPDFWIIKINSLGIIEWQNTIGTIAIDEVSEVINAIDGGYIIAGYSNGSISGDKTDNAIGDFDCWILKLDINGTIMWQKTVGGSLKDQLRTINITSDGNYLLGAFSNSNISGNKTENTNGGGDVWLIEIDPSGNIVWDKTVGGSGEEKLYSIVEDNEGRFYIGCISNSNISNDKTESSRGGYDYWVVKTDSSGVVLWDKTMGGAEDEFNTTIVYNTIDDSIIIGGTSASSNTGDKTEISRGSYDYWIVKLEPALAITNFTATKIQAYPNPTTKWVQIILPQVFESLNVSLLNILGQEVQQETFSNTSKINLAVNGQPGIYLVTIRNEKGEKINLKIVKK